MDKPLCALVVDDERDIEFLFRQRFRKEIRSGSIEMAFAFSGEEALNMLTTGAAADVVLLLSDINMPGMNGLELLKSVKRDYPKIRVFMVTAYGNDDNYRTAIEYGADGYMNKPIDFQSLKETMTGIHES